MHVYNIIPLCRTQRAHTRNGGNTYAHSSGVRVRLFFVRGYFFVSRFLFCFFFIFLRFVWSVFCFVFLRSWTVKGRYRKGGLASIVPLTERGFWFSRGQPRRRDRPARENSRWPRGFVARFLRFAGHLARPVVNKLSDTTSRAGTPEWNFAEFDLSFLSAVA